MDSAKDQNRSASKLRYPLRSAGKSRDFSSPGSSLKKGITSSIRASIGALKPSKEKGSPEPVRRADTPYPKTRLKRSVLPEKDNSPIIVESKPAEDQKINELSSVSYWLSQIKLSESVSNHNLSLGFFKLALESKGLPLEGVREELKSYANRHNILKLGQTAREVLKSYNILEEVQSSPKQKLVKITEKNLANAPNCRTPRTSSDSKKPKAKSVNSSESKKKPSPTSVIRMPISEEEKENLDDELVEESKTGSEVVIV